MRGARDLAELALIGVVRGLLAVLDTVSSGGPDPDHDDGPDCWCAPELWALCDECYAESLYCPACGGHGMRNVTRGEYDEADKYGCAVELHRTFRGVDV